MSTLNTYRVYLGTVWTPLSITSVCLPLPSGVKCVNHQHSITTDDNLLLFDLVYWILDLVLVTLYPFWILIHQKETYKHFKMNKG